MNNSKDTRDPTERIKSIQRAVEKARAESQTLQYELSPPLTEDESITLENELKGAPEQNTRRPHTSQDMVNYAEQNLFKQQQLGLFTSYPLQPSNEYPTLLSRLPIFVPHLRTEQAKHLDEDLAYCFDTPWGKGRRLGPPVSIYDEDVLIALTRLRNRRLYGPGGDLPVPVNSDLAEGDGNVQVHTVICTVTQIIEELKITDAGKNYRSIVASIKRLAATSIEVNVTKHDRYFGPVKKGTNIKLLDVVWEEYREHSIIYAQFNPVIVRWLENDYSYIDWDIRRKLTRDAHKAIHRFLSSQGRAGKWKITTIANTLGLNIPQKKLKTVFKEAMEQLEKAGWCTYEITGTGRKTPHMLQFRRT